MAETFEHIDKKLDTSQMKMCLVLEKREHFKLVRMNVLFLFVLRDWLCKSRHKSDSMFLRILPFEPEILLKFKYISTLFFLKKLSVV